MNQEERNLEVPGLLLLALRIQLQVELLHRAEQQHLEDRMSLQREHRLEVLRLEAPLLVRTQCNVVEVQLALHLLEAQIALADLDLQAALRIQQFADDKKPFNILKHLPCEPSL